MDLAPPANAEQSADPAEQLHVHAPRGMNLMSGAEYVRASLAMLAAAREEAKG